MNDLRAEAAVVERERIGSAVTVLVAAMGAGLACCDEFDARMVESEVAKGTGLLRFFKDLVVLLLVFEEMGIFEEEVDDLAEDSLSDDWELPSSNRTLRTFLDFLRPVEILS